MVRQAEQETTNAFLLPNGPVLLAADQRNTILCFARAKSATG
jgi:hypothetical protein